MAWTQAQIDALKVAIASGTLTLRDGDQMVTYRSIQEMRDVLAMMEGEVNGNRPRRTLARYSSGV